MKEKVIVCHCQEVHPESRPVPVERVQPPPDVPMPPIVGIAAGLLGLFFLIGGAIDAFSGKK